jgi:hypothetical protein
LNGNLSSGQTEKGKTGEQQSQEHAHHFLCHQGGLFTRNSSWWAEQSVPHTTVMIYGYCVKMYEDFALNFCVKELAVLSRQNTI